MAKRLTKPVKAKTTFLKKKTQPLSLQLPSISSEHFSNKSKKILISQASDSVKQIQIYYGFLFLDSRLELSR